MAILWQQHLPSRPLVTRCCHTASLPQVERCLVQAHTRWLSGCSEAWRQNCCHLPQSLARTAADMHDLRGGHLDHQDGHSADQGGRLAPCLADLLRTGEHCDLDGADRRCQQTASLHPHAASNDMRHPLIPEEYCSEEDCLLNPGCLHSLALVQLSLFQLALAYDIGTISR